MGNKNESHTNEDLSHINEDLSHTNEDLSYVNMIYDIKRSYNNNLNIFGAKFVENKCKMIMDNKEYEITNKYNIENYKKINNNKINIKLKGINNVTDMSYMFSGCKLLLSLPDISKWNINNVTNMSYMLDGCSSLSSLPDISKWNTNNVINMSYMF